jgi:hypothetical protein
MSSHPPPKDVIGSLLRRQRKCRPDSLLGRLTEGQANELEEWLFNAHPKLTLEQARTRLEKEFRVSVCGLTVQRWYQKTAQRRSIASIGDSMKNSNEVLAEFEKHPHDTYKTVLFLLGKFAFDQANAEGPKDKALLDLTKLIIIAKKEERAVAQLKLSLDKFHFDAARSALREAAWLKEIQANTALDDDQKLQAVMLKLFGPPPPK